MSFWERVIRRLGGDELADHTRKLISLQGRRSQRNKLYNRLRYRQPESPEIKLLKEEISQLDQEIEQLRAILLDTKEPDHEQ